jgi:hypothetical protein
MAAQVLPDLFESFCAYVLERYVAPLLSLEWGAAATVAARSSEQNGAAAPPSGELSELAEDERITRFEETLVDLSASERDALVKTRVGQSSFRDKLLHRWSSSCSVTGLKNPAVLIASHIVPWSQCKTGQRTLGREQRTSAYPRARQSIRAGLHQLRARGSIPWTHNRVSHS